MLEDVVAELALLRRLSLEHCTEFDGELPELSGLRALSYLSLSGTDVDDYRPALRVSCWPPLRAALSEERRALYVQVPAVSPAGSIG